MEYADHLPVLAASHPLLAAKLQTFATLEHVLSWLAADQYPLALLDMVTQDEYCHDLLLPLPGTDEWLVLGMT